MGTVGEQVPAAPRVRPRAAGARLYWIAAAVVLADLGFLVFRGLGNATLYFRTADEAVAQRQSLGTRRFRIEGTVVAAARRDGDDVTFTITSNGTAVDVLHHGDPPELFKPGIPVVLEGRFDRDRAAPRFLSDRIMVKHSENYIARHPERVTTTVPTSR